MKPLVSILIPAYNADKWIAESIRSALAQTWPNKEIVIVDDGSKDQTLAVARQFASNSVTIVTQPNQGASAARNTAYSLCHGDYIQWLDADDLLAPCKIEKQMDMAMHYGNKRTLFSAPWAHFYYRHNKARFSPTGLWDDLDPVEWLIRKMRDGLHMQTATWLVSRDLTEAAGSWNTRLLYDDDGEYFCRVKLRCNGIKFVREARVFYRQVCCNRVSHVGRSNPKLEAQWASMQLHIRYLLSLEDSERTRAACVKYLQRYLQYFAPERVDLANELRARAISLGGRLNKPKLSWKYVPVQKIFGLSFAKELQDRYNSLKSSVIGEWDRLLWLSGL